MSRVIVIVVSEISERTGRKELVVSHGVDEDTGRLVVLPQEDPRVLGAKFDPRLGEYVLE